MGKGALHHIARLHVSPALDDSTEAIPVLVASGGLPGQSAGCVGTLEELAVEAGKAARRLLAQVVWERVFSEEHKFFSTEGIRSPQHQISPCRQNLTLPLLQSISSISLD